MYIQTAQNQTQAIYNEAQALLKIENPTDSDWARLAELYQRFMDIMDEREIDPPESEVQFTTDIDALAEELVQRMTP